MQRGTVAQGSGKRVRVQRVVCGKSPTAAETRSGKRAGARGSAEMTPAAEIRAAGMPTAMVATAVKMRAPMTTAVMTPAVSTTMAAATMAAAAMTAAAFRCGISCGRQYGRQHNDGDPDIEF
jgi:hypothetical protein